ncbi:MAG TPA: helix-turn-helix transcriptional regulator [Symbiobacteriaceae bacterium]|nr:helix-turn-helix transcriptional regulator [Symbiobacteriaceae bacterium]
MLTAVKGTENSIRHSLGLRLRQLRENYGLVQQDVADLFETNRNVPSQWESGAREPSLEIILDLAAFYGVTVDWLLGVPNADKDAPDVRQIKRELGDYLRLKEPTLRYTGPEVRLKLAFSFLCERNPEQFSLDRIAQAVNITPSTFLEMMEGRVRVSGPVIQRFADYAKLPELWFWQPEPQLGDPTVRYQDLAQRFHAEGLSPEEIERRVWGPTKRAGGRSPRRGSGE